MSIRVLAKNYIRSMTPKVPVRKMEHMWKKPSTGRVKVNVDASFHADTLSGTCGVVVRDECEDFIAAAEWFLSHIRDVDSAKLTAIRNGLYLVGSLGCNNADIESDCMFVVESVQLMDAYLGPDVALIAECKQPSMDFVNISFMHCFREASQVADEIARHSFSSINSSTWDTEIPDFISHLLVNDMTII